MRARCRRLALLLAAAAAASVAADPPPSLLLPLERREGAPRALAAGAASLPLAGSVRDSG